LRKEEREERREVREEKQTKVYRAKRNPHLFTIEGEEGIIRF
jgi:hypothetical protein